MRASPGEYLALDLRAHDMLRGVALHDVSVVDLPDGGAGRTVGEVRALMTAAKPGLIVAALTTLRCAIGRVLGWDAASESAADGFVARVAERDRLASEIPPGTRAGMFRVLYQFPREALCEVRNATVHAFLCTALEATSSGYRFYWAVYVMPTSWITPWYLAAIEPFRRYLLYPAILRRLRKDWVARYPRSVP
jgi:hypothetical protein